MTEATRQPKEKNYNLIAVLYHSSDNVESLKSYIQDAEAEGDQELVEFFGGILQNNLRAAQRAKEMLVPRFQSEQKKNSHILLGQGYTGLGFLVSVLLTRGVRGEGVFSERTSPKGGSRELGTWEK